MNVKPASLSPLKSTLKWIILHPQEFIMGVLGVVFVCLLLKAIWGGDPPVARRRHCFVNDANKIAMDKAFMPVQFKGLVTSMEVRQFPQKQFITHLYLDVFEDSMTVFTNYRCPYFGLSSVEPVYVGMDAGMVNYAAVGDTILKTRGTYKFLLLRSKGDTLITELSGPVHCWNGDCTYERDGSMLCFYY